MQKEQRQTAILKIINTRKTGKQEEIADILEKKGFAVTQSSVSRDLEELGIIKIDGFYGLPSKPKNAISFGLNALETAGENLIIAKCESGLASAVAVRIDALELKEIVGTIAGDDTIFVAVKNSDNQKFVIKHIWDYFKEI